MFGGEVAWLPDNSGFLYTPQNSSDPKDLKGTLDTRARLHRLGTAAKADPELFSRAKYPKLGLRPDQYPYLFYSDDNTQLYGLAFSVDNRVTAWVTSPAELLKPSIAWKRVAAPADSVYGLYGFLKLGTRMYLHSVKGARHGKILVTDAANPNPATAAVLLPEGPLNITGIVSTKDFLFVKLNDGINDQIRQYDPRTKQWAPVPLPLTGSVSITPLDAPRSNDVHIGLTSWKQPLTIYD
ncbi:MAG TPA: S9 family peptidase, partial [Hymenobacter sp.]